MTFGGNASYKTLFHRKDRELVEGYLNCFKAELKTVNEMSTLQLGVKNYRWVELNAKKEFCEKLLGRKKG